MGWLLGLAKKYEEEDKGLSKVYMFYAILVPTLLHTTYNFCLLANKPSLFVIFVVFIIVLYIISVITIEKTSENNQSIEKIENL